MTYITTNAELVALIANVATPVTGEDDLFTKITPQLLSAEMWLHHNVAPASVLPLASLSENQLHLVRTIVAYEAFRNAIPALNMILTDNGFGIVSNQTIAPASRDRTDALIRSLIAQRDIAIELLADSLSGTGTVFAGMLFPGYMAQRLQGITENLFDRFMEQRPKLLMEQQRIAKKAVSAEVMTALVGYAYTPIANIPAAYQPLINLVQETIVAILKADDPNQFMHIHRHNIRMIVDYIRNDETTFPNWEDSEAAEYWQDKTFKNEKDSKAYWL